ncbi:hypothetical protein ACU4GR_10680 (plasmid) [Methylobacterium oryzae CBMB20]|uniref:hypothetical protein n=1 Tax=Methylobacterium TaxID=407 RepID=UPI002F360925
MVAEPRRGTPNRVEGGATSGGTLDRRETVSCVRGAAVARQLRIHWAVPMPQNVDYRIIDRPDGQFEVVVKLASGKIFRRSGCISRAEADTWIEGLRMLMAAIGAPVSIADATPEDISTDGSQTMHDAGHSEP